MPAFYSRTLKDYDGETTSHRLRIPEINAGNMATIVTLTANYGAAVNDMTLGSLQNLRYGNETIANSPAPTDPYAQRELSWFVSYVDDVTGKPYHVNIGTPDLSLLDPDNKGYADMSNADVIAFVTAFEALAVSEAGNTVTVQSIKLVGRSL
jgi:hypothetical protein